jgi:hypothetical protein
MAGMSRQSSGVSPPAVSVHDDGDMSWHLLLARIIHRYC